MNETRSTAAAKQKVASILANVLAHQWLGNLVTMDWWDSVWLNEAFSTFIADVGVDFVYTFLTILSDKSNRNHVLNLRS